MSNTEKIERIVYEIIEIEKISMQKRFNSVGGENEKFHAIKADAEVVNCILTLLEREEKDGEG